MNNKVQDIKKLAEAITEKAEEFETKYGKTSGPELQDLYQNLLEQVARFEYNKDEYEHETKERIESRLGIK